MSAQTLFLAWQDRSETSRRWYPVGRLDTDTSKPLYRYRYTRGALRAQQEVGFPLVLDFPELEGDYKSRALFPMFANRIIARGRPDRLTYLEHLDLADSADPIEILAANGGWRATDSYEVFPKLRKRADGSFRYRFFLHGWRYVSEAAQERLQSLRPDEELYLSIELTNPTGNLALQVQTLDYHMIGWAPRYLVLDLTTALKTSFRYKARVVRVNPQPAPMKQRLLIEMSGNLGAYEPMSGKDFAPLVRGS